MTTPVREERHGAGERPLVVDPVGAREVAPARVVDDVEAGGGDRGPLHAREDRAALAGVRLEGVPDDLVPEDRGGGRGEDDVDGARCGGKARSGARRLAEGGGERVRRLAEGARRLEREGALRAGAADRSRGDEARPHAARQEGPGRDDRPLGDDARDLDGQRQSPRVGKGACERRGERRRASFLLVRPLHAVPGAARAGRRGAP